MAAVFIVVKITNRQQCVFLKDKGRDVVTERWSGIVGNLVVRSITPRNSDFHELLSHQKRPIQSEFEVGKLGSVQSNMAAPLYQNPVLCCLIATWSDSSVIKKSTTVLCSLYLYTCCVCAFTCKPLHRALLFVGMGYNAKLKNGTVSTRM